MTAKSEEAATKKEEGKKAEAKPGYKESSWNGKTNYECNQCPFATLSKPLMVQHVGQKHRAKVD